MKSTSRSSNQFIGSAVGKASSYTCGSQLGDSASEDTGDVRTHFWMLWLGRQGWRPGTLPNTPRCTGWSHHRVTPEEPRPRSPELNAAGQKAMRTIIVRAESGKFHRTNELVSSTDEWLKGKTSGVL